MIQIRNLSVIHQKDLRQLISDFSITLNSGDKAVIIGEEGNGKSTLLKWLYQPELIADYAEVTGERIPGKERLGYLPQELPESDGRLSVYEYFCGSDFFSETSPRELSALAKSFHLDEDFFYLGQSMHSLSGGEKVKAQILRLLLEKPTALLLDEPSNDIDIETLEWMEDLISKFTGIVLYISHDELLIERTANTIIHLEQLRHKALCRHTIQKTDYLTYIAERENLFQHQAQQAISDRREKRIRDEKYQRIMQSVEYAQANITRQDPHGGKMLKRKMHAIKSMGKRFEQQDEEMAQMPEQEYAISFKLGEYAQPIPAGKTLLDYKLSKLFTPDGRILSKNIQLYIRGPQKVCIIGKNGVGKTTLLRKIAEELLQRSDIQAGYMPQNYADLLPKDLSPIEWLNLSGEKEERTKIRSILGSLRFTDQEMERTAYELSGGQKAKLIFLKLSLSGANVLILDEPTRNLSPLSNPVIRKLIKSFPGAVISVSHDRKYISEVSTEVYELLPDQLKKCNNFLLD